MRKSILKLDYFVNNYFWSDSKKFRTAFQEGFNPWKIGSLVRLRLLLPSVFPNFGGAVDTRLGKEVNH